MSTPPRFAERKRPPVEAPARPEPAEKPRLSERLLRMSDDQLSAYQASALRIGSDPAHPKSAAAIRAQPFIAAEIQRRADAPQPDKPPA